MEKFRKPDTMEKRKNNGRIEEDLKAIELRSYLNSVGREPSKRGRWRARARVLELEDVII